MIENFNFFFKGYENLYFKYLHLYLKQWFSFYIN